MHALSRQVLEGFAAERPPLDALARLGVPDPGRDAEALARAAGHPDLAATPETWLPPLLASASPGAGAESLVELAQAWREEAGEPFALERWPVLPALLGASTFLARWLRGHPEALRCLAGDPPPAPGDDTLAADWDAIRRAKYQGLLAVAGRDLAGRSFREGLRELSDMADRCLDAALRCAAEATGCAPPALLALGKLGGRELNFSSDVDLLFVYESAEGDPDLRRNQEVADLIRQLKTHLERPTAEGFGYRVDLDLRPEGETGALANSVHAAVAYYEGFGAEWERQALLRLRPVAGEPGAGEALLRELEPFVYRRTISPDVLRSVGSMKARIERERRRAGRDLDAELKEGPGGIRDVEFLVQALQLLYAGREPSLRTGNVLDGLDALARLGVLPEATAAALCRAYLWLRRAEHALQLEGERQTQRVPGDPAGRLGLARRMGYADVEGERARDRMLDDWTSVRVEVRSHFEALVLGSEVESGA